MVNKNIIDTTLEQAREWGNALYLPGGLVLTDQIAHASISQEPQRMNFILMALCRKGKATYSIDTREQTVRPGDLFFISERHINTHIHIHTFNLAYSFHIIAAQIIIFINSKNS